MRRTTAAALIALALAFWWGIAAAQDCTELPGADGTFRVCYEPHTPTPSAPATSTSAPTNTPAWEPTPMPTPPPTAAPTSTPPPSTATPAPLEGQRVNVPLLSIPAPDPAYDANHYGITWLGRVVDSTYTDARFLAGPDALRIRLQMIDDRLTPADAVTLEIGDWRQIIRHGDAGAFATDLRCTGEFCRGWGATGSIPWATFGQAPTAGDEWPMTITRSGGHTWRGVLHFGLPDYDRPSPAGAVLRYATLPVVADATIGGGTDCGAPDWPDYFPTWGSRNWGESPYAIAQNQWDIADWPCYAKHALRWRIDGLPRDAEIISATLTMQHFGDPGYGDGQADDATKTTIFQVFELAPGWSETGIAWDTAAAGENVSRATVEPVPAACNRFCDPPIPEAFDVAEITRRALADPARTTADALIYTAAGQYHAGKQFWSRESSNPPEVRIAYVTNKPSATATATQLPTGTPQATYTTTPLATATRQPTVAPVVPTATATPRPSATATATATNAPSTPTPTNTPTAGTGRTLYISPGTPYPWSKLQPGDTLILRDGTYPPMRPNARNGQPGRPITIRAEHDGGAVIDGRGGAYAIQIGDTWPGPVGEWYVLEGLVARNAEDVIIVKGANNILRRVSAYDADVNGNSAVITVAWTHDVLIEDCIAAGTGRKMMLVFGASDVTIRRCFARWERWDGQDPSFCGVTWPSGNGIHLYGGGPNLRIENALSLGPVAGRNIATTNQSDTAAMERIEILGSIATQAGANPDGTPYQYPLPSTNGCGWKAPWNFYPGEINGFTIYGQGPTRDVTLRDVLATGNGFVGFEIFRPTATSIGGQRVTLDHATIYGNATYGTYPHGARIPQVVEDSQLTITNSRIAGTRHQGEGARLTNRYVDGVLTDAALLPWPMEQRGLDELGINISEMWAEYARQ